MKICIFFIYKKGRKRKRKRKKKGKKRVNLDCYCCSCLLIFNKTRQDKTWGRWLLYGSWWWKRQIKASKQASKQFSASHCFLISHLLYGRGRVEKEGKGRGKGKERRELDLLNGESRSERAPEKRGWLGDERVIKCISLVLCPALPLWIF